MTPKVYYYIVRVMSRIYANFRELCSEWIDTDKLDIELLSYEFLRSKTMERLYDNMFTIQSDEAIIVSDFISELKQNGRLSNIYSEDGNYISDEGGYVCVGSLYGQFMLLEIHPRFLPILMSCEYLDRYTGIFLYDDGTDFALDVTKRFCLRVCNDANVSQFAEWIEQDKEPTLEDLKERHYI